MTWFGHHENGPTTSWTVCGFVDQVDESSSTDDRPVVARGRST